MSKIRLGGLLVVGALLAAGCGSSTEGGGARGGGDGDSGPITIGAIHPTTGPLAGEGQQMVKAVRMAVEDVNAAGGISSLDGAKLAVEPADSQGKPEVGQSAATQLIQRGAVALVGPYQSAVAANVAAVAERGQVPFVIDVAASDAILDQGYKYSFRVQPNASAMGLHGARFLKGLADESGQPVRKVAYLHEQTDFGTSVMKAFKAEAEKLGMTVDPVISYDAQKASDLTTEVTRVKAARADVLAVTGYYRDGVLIARNVASVKPGVKAVFGVANGAYDLPQFPAEAGAAGEGFFDANYHFDVTKQETKDVLARFKQRYGEDMRTAAVLSYEAVRVIEAGLEKAGSRDPKALREAIAGISLDSLLTYQEPITFDQTGQNPQAVPVLMQVQQGQVKQVFPEAFAEAKPNFPAN